MFPLKSEKYKGQTIYFRHEQSPNGLRLVRGALYLGPDSSIAFRGTSKAAVLAKIKDTYDKEASIYRHKHRVLKFKNDGRGEGLSGDRLDIYVQARDGGASHSDALDAVQEHATNRR